MSQASGWIQAAAVIAALVLLHIPLGDYIARVLGPSGSDGKGIQHWRVERAVYRLCGVNAQAEQDWRQYLRSVFALSASGILVLYLLLRLQAHLPYSQGLGGLSPALA